MSSSLLHPTLLPYLKHLLHLITVILVCTAHTEIFVSLLCIYFMLMSSSLRCWDLRPWSYPVIHAGWSTFHKLEIIPSTSGIRGTRKHEDPWPWIYLGRAHKPDGKPSPYTWSADGVCTGKWGQLVTWHVRAFPWVLTPLSHPFSSVAASLTVLKMETISSFPFLEGLPQDSSVNGPIVCPLASLIAVTQGMCPEFTVVLWSCLCVFSNGVLSQCVPEENEVWLYK